MPWTLNDYEVAINKFCSDNPDLVIFLAGEISHPGISDLDFLVLDAEPVIDDIVRPFLMGGNVLILPEFAIEKVKTLDNLNLNQIQGQQYTLEDPPDFLKFIEIIEWLPERVLKCQFFLKSDGPLYQALLLHKSINRSITAVERIVGETYPRMTVSDARSLVLENNGQTLIEESVECGLSAWEDFSDFMKSAGLLAGSCRGNVSVCDYYSFSDQFELLMLYFSYVCSARCTISDKMKKRITLSSSGVLIDEQFGEFIKDRWAFLNSILVWFEDRQLTKGMIKYGWLLDG